MNGPALARLVLVGSLSVAGAGCIPVPTSTLHRTGWALPREPVDALGPETPLKNVLTILGPPDAVARPGKVIELPLYPGRKEGSREISSDGLFARFHGSRSPGLQEAIYVYEAQRFERSAWFVTFVGLKGELGRSHADGTDRLVTDRLLLLVDRERRVVVDKLREQVATAARQRPVSRPAAEAP